jgi:hypothetical protein
VALDASHSPFLSVPGQVAEVVGKPDDAQLLQDSEQILRKY